MFFYSPFQMQMEVIGVPMTFLTLQVEMPEENDQTLNIFIKYFMSITMNTIIFLAPSPSGPSPPRYSYNTLYSEPLKKNLTKIQYSSRLNILATKNYYCFVYSWYAGVRRLWRRWLSRQQVTRARAHNKEHIPGPSMTFFAALVLESLQILDLERNLYS